jgi:superfamily I DNA and/or RNA helicase
MPVIQLNVQHRMRPEIASLISPTIYENLQNSDSVTKYPRVTGVKENVFFVSHRHAEGKNKGTKSYSNEFEAKFLCRFYKYLLQQGYKEEQITVLCPYIGQMFCLQREFVNHGLSKLQ